MMPQAPRESGGSGASRAAAGKGRIRGYGETAASTAQSRPSTARTLRLTVDALVARTGSAAQRPEVAGRVVAALAHRRAVLHLQIARRAAQHAPPRVPRLDRVAQLRRQPVLTRR